MEKIAIVRLGSGEFVVAKEITNIADDYKPLEFIGTLKPDSVYINGELVKSLCGYTIKTK